MIFSFVIVELEMYCSDVLPVFVFRFCTLFDKHRHFSVLAYVD